MDNKITVKNDNMYNVLTEEITSMLPNTIEDFKQQGIVFKTVTDDMLKEMQEYAPEISRAKNSFGKSQSQFMRNLMTFDSHTPYRNLRQILAEIEKKQTALNEAQIKHQKTLLRLKKLKEKEELTEADKLTMLEIVNKIQTSTLYIEGAIKEIYAMEQSYKDIMESNGIENWDEEDFEKEEEEFHIKKAFTQGIADMTTGALSSGNNIYFRQIGINPLSAVADIRVYIHAVNNAISNGQLVTMKDQYDFLDSMYKKYKGSTKFALDRNKIKSTFKSKGLFKDRNKELSYKED